MLVMPRLACPSCRWITTSGTPSCAISTACACRSWCGANHRRTPAPCPAVHPDLAPLAAFPSPDEHRATAAVEIALLESERFADPQPRAPQQDDQRAKPVTVG